MLDDDPTARRAACAVLESCGYEVVGQAAMALEALVMADILQPDLMVLELHLDGMSGVEALPALRSASPETTFVAFTNLPGMRDEALVAGVLEVIDKVGLQNLDGLRETVELVAETLGVSV